jgi:copper(I)-binding protein
MKPLLPLIAALALAAPASAHQIGAGALNIVHPWARPAAKGMNGVIYVKVTNLGSKPDVLLAIETPVAERVELHEGSMAGGVMRMGKLKSVAIPAHGTATFQPGGNHVMLVRLKQPLAVGQMPPLTFVFQNAGRVKGTFMVMANAGDPMPGMRH